MLNLLNNFPGLPWASSAFWNSSPLTCINKKKKKKKDIIQPRTSFDRQFLDLLQRIFVYDPRRRITAKEALRHPWFSTSPPIDNGFRTFQSTRL